MLHCDVLRPEVFIPITLGTGQDTEHTASARVLLLAPVSRIQALKVVTLLEFTVGQKIYVVNFHISDIVNTLSDEKNEFIYDAEKQ